jgi:hypothetical protein
VKSYVGFDISCPWKKEIFLYFSLI